MPLDGPLDLMQATVQVEQARPGGRSTVGAGFLVTAADGRPRTVLITARHVFDNMPGQEVRIGYRSQRLDGGWTFTPRPLRIREADGDPLWADHPSRDVAAIVVQAPPAFARAAIPLSALAADDAAAERNIRLGDEMMVLGFPRGIAANSAGFPILRSGRVASYPVSPRQAPTFMLDFAVFPGNSGGPVFRIGEGGPVVTGVLTQEIELDRERLDIGIVTHAKYVMETVRLIDGVKAPAGARSEDAVGARPATESGPSLWRRALLVAGAFLQRIGDAWAAAGQWCVRTAA